MLALAVLEQAPAAVGERLGAASSVGGAVTLLFLAALFVVLGFEYVLRHVVWRRRSASLLFGLLGVAMGTEALAAGLAAVGVLDVEPAARIVAVALHLKAVLAVQVLWRLAERPIGFLLRLYQGSHLSLVAFAVLATDLEIQATSTLRVIWFLPLLLGALELAWRWSSAPGTASRVLGGGLLVVLAAHLLAVAGHLGLVPPVATAVKLGSFAILLLALRFVEERRLERNHAELKRLRANLEAQVEARTRELEEARARAEAEAVARREFTYALSHEVRTPVHSVLGLADWLLELQPPPLARSLAELVRTSGRNLLELLNGVLDLARLEEGGQTLREMPFVPAEVVEEALDVSSARAWERDLRLTRRIDPAVPGIVIGDRSRILEVLVNVVGNAVKFTESGGVAVELLVVDEGDGPRLRFSVTDTGPGIPEPTLAHLFEPFWRGQDPSRGSGLGLAISRRLIALLGGRLWVESEEGVGTVVHFTAAVRPAEEAWLPLAERARQLRGRTVVVLAQDPEVRAVTVDRLATFGMQPRVFDRPAEAAGWLATQHGAPTLVLGQGEPTAGAPVEPRSVSTRDPASAAECDFAGELADLRRSDLPLRWVELPPVCRGSGGEAGWEGWRELLRELVEAAEESDAASVPAAAAPLRILVADDDEINLEVSLHLLTRLGHRAEGVVDGQGVLRRVLEADFDVVFLDLGLPDVSGVEVARRLRRMLPARSLPLIAALTARAEMSLREHCLKVGMDAYLVKPVVLEDLEALLSSRRPRVAADRGRGWAIATGKRGADASDPEPRVVDWGRLRMLAELGEAEEPDLLPSLVRRFETTCVEDLYALYVAAEAADRTGFAEVAHRLAGRSANLGFLRVAAFCRRLERSAPREAPEVLHHHLEGLAEEVDQALLELRRGAPERLPGDALPADAADATASSAFWVGSGPAASPKRWAAAAAWGSTVGGEAPAGRPVGGRARAAGPERGVPAVNPEADQLRRRRRAGG